MESELNFRDPDLQGANGGKPQADFTLPHLPGEVHALRPPLTALPSPGTMVADLGDISVVHSSREGKNSGLLWSPFCFAAEAERLPAGARHRARVNVISSTTHFNPEVEESALIYG